jgi:uncharacterized protein with PIN domain
MKQAGFFFIGDLSELLPPEKRGRPYLCLFRGAQSVKHLIESVGIPHTEVGSIDISGRAVDFNYIVQNGDEVQVLPVLALTGGNSLGVPSQAAGQARFVLDNHLGRLAFFLRMLGFDTLYQNDYQDNDIAQISSQAGRILLTRDRRLLMRSKVVYGYLVRSKIPRQQLLEVVQRFSLAGQIMPFLRCMRCNGLLHEVKKEDILSRLEPLTRQYFDEFRICQDCQQIYWKGSHYERMLRIIKEVVDTSPKPQLVG